MLTRIHGEIQFECDGCSEVLDTGSKDFDDARATLKSEGWKSEKNGADWSHYCAECSST